MVSHDDCVEHMGKIRVLLADDHETIQTRVRSILCEDFEVVGTVGNGRDAVTEVGRLDPDVLVPLRPGEEQTDPVRRVRPPLS